MVDIKHFHIWVRPTDVKKGWDWIEIRGQRRSIAPGKYVKIYGPRKFGFEDLTEEIGETPDYDYNEPLVEVVEERGVIQKTIVLRITWDAGYHIQLYYKGRLVSDSQSGAGQTVTINEVNYSPIVIGGAIAVPAIVITMMARRRR